MTRPNSCCRRYRPPFSSFEVSPASPFLPTFYPRRRICRWICRRSHRRRRSIFSPPSSPLVLFSSFLRRPNRCSPTFRTSFSSVFPSSSPRSRICSVPWTRRRSPANSDSLVYLCCPGSSRISFPSIFSRRRLVFRVSYPSILAPRLGSSYLSLRPILSRVTRSSLSRPASIPPSTRIASKIRTRRRVFPACPICSSRRSSSRIWRRRWRPAWSVSCYRR